MKRLVVITFLIIQTLQADLPSGKLVMLDIADISYLTSKRDTSELRLNFEELLETGINGIYFRAWLDENSYDNWPELVNEAHEYGLWVGGGINNFYGQLNTIKLAAQAAERGVDFLQIEWPLTESCVGQKDAFQESEYAQLKQSARKSCIHSSCPVIISDMNCNNMISSWNVDGFANTLYSQTEITTSGAALVNYQTNNPDKWIAAWSWLLSYDPASPDSARVDIPDSEFDSNFEYAYTQFGNVLLFGWNMRDYKNTKGLHGASWNARVASIKRVTGMGQQLPEWRNFSPVNAVSRSAPDCQVEVRSAATGLDPASVECYYTTDSVILFNTKWIRHYDVECSGVKGTTAWQTILARNVPFNQASENLNKIMFKIKNTYSGNYFRNAQAFKRTYTVPVETIDWSGLSNDGLVSSLPAALSIAVQSASGLDVSSVICEYSTDGGSSWKSHRAECSGKQGSTDKETVVVNDLPLIADKGKLNKVRFRILTINGDTLKSAVYPLTINTPPDFISLAPQRMADELDFTLKFQDKNGIRIGPHTPVNSDETILLLHCDGDMKDASGNGYDGTFYNEAQYTGEGWSTTGGSGQAISFDGLDDFGFFGFGEMGFSETFTLSAWVKPENKIPPIAIGEEGGRGSLILKFDNNKAYVTGTDMITRDTVTLESAADVPFGSWYHITVTFDGVSGKIFINGDKAAEEDWSGFRMFSFRPFRLGKATSQGFFYKGEIDEVHLMNRALTEGEVAAEYYSGMYRYSSDGGKNWSKWIKTNINVSDGSVETAEIKIIAVALRPSADSLNRIQFAVRDVNGNTADREYILLEDDAVPVENVNTRLQNVEIYPNPFRFSTSISLNLLSPQKVEISVYNSDGRKVVTLHEGLVSAGKSIFCWNSAASIAELGIVECASRAGSSETTFVR
ncbi:MAG: hypothetical protein HQK83_19240, partial [Fibrobacteria bacterium]|nr:hypothetical protein [Fibrobacteria bacterium]